jgi:hypothetical protein
MMLKLKLFLEYLLLFQPSGLRHAWDPAMVALLQHDRERLYPAPASVRVYFVVEGIPF